MLWAAGSDWDAALAAHRARDADRADRLLPNNWYRYRLTRELVETTDGDRDVHHIALRRPPDGAANGGVSAAGDHATYSQIMTELPRHPKILRRLWKFY